MTDTERRLREIEEREKAATKGPWACERDGENFTVGIAPDWYVGWVPELDAAFIAASRDDIPWLVARVRRLEEALREQREHLHRIRQEVDHAYHQLEITEHIEMERRIDDIDAVLYNAAIDCDAALK